MNTEEIAQSFPPHVARIRHLRAPVAAAEAAIAQRHVHLAPEPPGERAGIITVDGEHLPAHAALPEGGEPRLRLVAVGDSLVAGSGVSDQADSFIPRIAAKVAAASGRDVAWATHARLGSTMRRVRYRFMPEVEDADVLFVCAGSNDLLARRSMDEWTEDFAAVLDDAATRAGHVVACSAGQLYRSPSLMPLLRSVLLERTAAQTAISIRLCAERGVPYIDFSEMVPNEGFWAEDGFHPSGIGYELASGAVADAVMTALALDPADSDGDGHAAPSRKAS
ncbi:GDSL-type esterase/lipase family protein [Actinomyces haliotis]|uniref:GDSL-type esterase/lipase family protein n=1 Tax=Actinomyces haliotis TaxID=1280843 RepID=UPI002B27ACDC|nr:GDSL-type esterase/lipase family protein [Actinomyces haliotis]